MWKNARQESTQESAPPYLREASTFRSEVKCNDTPSGAVLIVVVLELVHGGEHEHGLHDRDGDLLLAGHRNLRRTLVGRFRIVIVP